MLTNYLHIYNIYSSHNIKMIYLDSLLEHPNLCDYCCTFPVMYSFCLDAKFVAMFFDVLQHPYFLTWYRVTDDYFPNFYHHVPESVSARIFRATHHSLKRIFIPPGIKDTIISIQSSELLRKQRHEVPFYLFTLNQLYVSFINSWESNYSFVRFIYFKLFDTSHILMFHLALFIFWIQFTQFMSIYFDLFHFPSLSEIRPRLKLKKLQRCLIYDIERYAKQLFVKHYNTGTKY